MRRKSLEDLLKEIKDPGLKLKMLSCADRVRHLTFEKNPNSNGNNVSLKFEFDFREFPERGSISGVEEYWTEREVPLILSPSSGFFAVIGAKDERTRTLLINFVTLSCDGTASSAFVSNNQLLEGLFNNLILTEREDLGRVNLFRSIFRNVGLYGEILEEMNIKAKSLHETELFKMVREGSRRWYAATYKITKIGEKHPASFRIDRYGKLLLYVDDLSHWLVDYITQFFFGILSSLNLANVT